MNILIAFALAAAVVSGCASKNRTCVGDCDGDCTVTAGELADAAALASGDPVVSLEDCRAADKNGDGVVTVDELSEASANAVGGCKKCD